MTYKQSSMINTRTPSQTLGLHRDSRSITKIQPKIRIIHIFAPEIIKTDVANFRELVQKLTGKPPPTENGGKDKGRRKPKNKKVNHDLLHDTDDVATRARIVCDKPTINTKLEFMMGTTTTTTKSSSSPSSSSDHHHYHHQHHDHQEFWQTTTVDRPNITSGGFLSAFTDLDDNFDLSMFNMAAVDGSSFGETTQLSFRG